MIKLKIEEYCEDCLEFKVVQEGTHYDNYGNYTDDCDIVLKCKNADKCKKLMEHLEQFKSNDK